MRISDWRSDGCSSDLAAMRVSPIPLARGLGATYVRLVRNTPLLVLMFLFAFGLPELDIRPEFDLNAWLGIEDGSRLLSFNVFFVFASTALGLYTAAFVCEAVRSGCNSVTVGQAGENGSASCRERVWQDGSTWGGDVSLKKK